MTMTRKSIPMLLAAMLLAAPVLAADSVDASGPGELIQTAAQSMLTALDADREAYRQDPKKVERLVEEVLLPHFDAQYAARLVLAKHWRTATPEQRERFIKGFYNSLLRNYGTALAEFTGDRLKVFPAQIAPDGERATVRTEVKRSNGERVPVNYTLRRTEGAWKAWDVTIEGISYVKSFREDFGSEIDAKGLDAVIERLERGDSPVKKSA
ncbi:MAG TPA: ABC transporter substrate-binding protein [Steroidobacteraceae bacterium]|nr:ABC transporter substrate-binding protein [Steroidobacteraceae bacterium]